MALLSRQGRRCLVYSSKPMPSHIPVFPIVSSIASRVQLSTAFKDLPRGLCNAGMKLKLGNASLFCASMRYFSGLKNGGGTLRLKVSADQTTRSRQQANLEPRSP
jgi:hypothetical protein